jgi:hypothetical protein
VEKEGRAERPAFLFGVGRIFIVLLRANLTGASWLSARRAGMGPEATQARRIATS